MPWAFRIVVLPGLVAIAAGCTEDAPLDCPADVPRLTVTAAEDTTVPVAEGDVTPIVLGPQGGHHVAFGVRIDDPAARYAMDASVTSGGELLADDHYEGRLRRDEGCTTRMEGFWAFLDQGPLAGRDGAWAPDLLVGEALTLDVRVQTDSGDAQVVLELVGGD